MNLTCNSTLEDLTIDAGAELKIAGPLDFHSLARLIAASCTLIAIAVSAYLMHMHARNYTKPREQKYIIRVIAMVPIYAISALLRIQFYRHAVYFEVISDCYEAVAIASFFALLCHYIAPDLHSQKEFFRDLSPIKPWSPAFLQKWWGGPRGWWRTPQSGLTWFNIIWIAIYQYCFIRVAMTITAVATEAVGRYCESSNNPVFAHVWTIVIDSISVTFAMFGIIQFYLQFRQDLAEHMPLRKVTAIKLVVFLCFWQSTAISLITSRPNLVENNDYIAYPDFKVGIPSLIICIEMALFSIFHTWAYPYAPYKPTAKTPLYPSPNPNKWPPSVENRGEPPRGGPGGIRAYRDAMNVWDVVKAFSRGTRWLFSGVKKRKADPSYKLSVDTSGDAYHSAQGHDAPGSFEYTGGRTEADTSARGTRTYRNNTYHPPTGEDADGLLTNAAGFGATSYAPQGSLSPSYSRVDDPTQPPGRHDYQYGHAPGPRQQGSAFDQSPPSQSYWNV